MSKKIEKNTDINVVVVCSTKGGEGKSTISMHLPLLFLEKEK